MVGNNETGLYGITFSGGLSVFFFQLSFSNNSTGFMFFTIQPIVGNRKKMKFLLRISFSLLLQSCTTFSVSCKLSIISNWK